GVQLVQEPGRLLLLAAGRGHHQLPGGPGDRDVEQPALLGQQRAHRHGGRPVPARRPPHHPPPPPQPAPPPPAPPAPPPPPATPCPCRPLAGGGVSPRAASPGGAWAASVSPGICCPARWSRKPSGPSPGNRSQNRAAASNSATMASRSRSAAAPTDPPRRLAA